MITNEMLFYKSLKDNVYLTRVTTNVVEFFFSFPFF